MTARTVSLVWPVDQLVNLNAERSLHHYQRARLVRPIREAFRHAAVDLAPLDGPVVVVGRFQWADRRVRDTSNWLPTLKAAVDGLVDAGVIARDDDKTVRDTRIGPDGAPSKGLRGHARITVSIEEVDA